MPSEGLVYGVDIGEGDIYEWLEARLKEAEESSKDIIIFDTSAIIDFGRMDFILRMSDGEHALLR